MNKHIIALLSSISLTVAAFGHGGVEIGPNGGRLVEFGEKAPLTAEISLKDDKFVIGLYDETAKKEVPVTAQILTVTHKEKNAKLAPELKDGKWTVAKPAGDDFWLILQLKPDAKGKAQNGRLHYEAAICGECKSPEWLCKCPAEKGAKEKK